MARYIDVEPLEDKLKEHIKKTESELMLGALSTFLRVLDITPTADVAPVRHGRWIELAMKGEYKCSVCGRGSKSENTFQLIPTVYWNYCPNCGARMDGEDDEID